MIEIREVGLVNMVNSDVHFVLNGLHLKRHLKRYTMDVHTDLYKYLTCLMFAMFTTEMYGACFTGYHETNKIQ